MDIEEFSNNMNVRGTLGLGSLGDECGVLLKDELDVGGRCLVGTDATVGTVSAAAHLASSVGLDGLDNESIGIKALFGMR